MLKKKRVSPEKFRNIKIKERFQAPPLASDWDAYQTMAFQNVLFGKGARSAGTIEFADKSGRSLFSKRYCSFVRIAGRTSHLKCFTTNKY